MLSSSTIIWRSISDAEEQAEEEETEQLSSWWMEKEKKPEDVIATRLYVATAAVIMRIKSSMERAPSQSVKHRLVVFTWNGAAACY